jgi:hypothetical protein
LVYCLLTSALSSALQVRNLIQKQKIDMANEVIDAGRFDMTTTMDERKATLEAMLQVSTRVRSAVVVVVVGGGGALVTLVKWQTCCDSKEEDASACIL